LVHHRQYLQLINRIADHLFYTFFPSAQPLGRIECEFELRLSLGPELELEKLNAGSPWKWKPSCNWKWCGNAASNWNK